MIEYICVYICKYVCMYGTKSKVCLRLRGDIELRFLSMIETIRALGIPRVELNVFCIMKYV